jgi:UDP-glucose 4-epimerase
MNHGTILVTGGAGYIGSHTVLQLRARGLKVVVLDNLYSGFRQAVLDAPLVVGNVGDRELVLQTLREHKVDTVMHFAAHTIVPESVSDRSTTATTRAPRAACCKAAPKPA